MTLYSIFEKPQAKAAKDRAPVAIAERFSWFAMLLTPLYALINGLWLLLIFWIVVPRIGKREPRDPQAA